MSRTVELLETYRCEDIVSLAICLYVYKVCRERQFESCSGSDFASFLNLNPTSRPVVVRARENLRVCYMIASIAMTIPSYDRAKLWTEGILNSCGITKSYYDKHRSDICSKYATEANKAFRETLDEAIETARKMK